MPNDYDDNNIVIIVVTLEFSTNLSIWFPETFVHFPNELWSGRTDIFANFEQIEYVIGRKHLGTLAGRWCAGLEFGKHGAGGGRRRWQAAASPEVWPTYLVGYSSGFKNRPEFKNTASCLIRSYYLYQHLIERRTTWNGRKITNIKFVLFQ